MNINELHFDDKNANKHTQKGLKLLEKSLQKLGAGRSILLDKDNNIIAGNGVVEVAGQIGLEKVRIIETDGNEIIAVKRKDISIDSKKGRELAIADNQTAKVGIDFDFDVINDLNSEFDFDFTNEWELPNFESDIDLSDKNKEIDVLGFENESILKLKYDFETYNEVLDKINKLEKTAEQIMLEALGL